MKDLTHPGQPFAAEKVIQILGRVWVSGSALSGRGKGSNHQFLQIKSYLRLLLLN